MTRKEMLEVITQRCIEVNPSVVNGSIGLYKNNKYIEQKKTTRPIRLADVLLAVKADNSIAFEDEVMLRIVGSWNLRKDDLNEQDEPTIDYIHDVLM